MIDIATMFMFPLLQSNFGVAQQNIFPLVIIALIIDAGIVAIWYMVGAILGSQKVKGSAKGELLQVAGTAVMAGIILAILLSFGGIFNSVVSNLPVGQSPSQSQTVFPMSQATIANLCASISNSNQNSGTFIFANALLTQLQPGICETVESPLSSGDGTVAMDYPLAASGVITANELVQSASNLNDLFIENAYLRFLARLTPTAALCIQTPDSTGCFPPDPAAPTGSMILYIEFTASPLAGLGLLTESVATLSTLMYMSLISLTIQLTFINLFLFAWPTLIFLGIVLRGTPFTRKVGGLLIAIALGGILFFPTIFAIEYLTAYGPTAPNTQFTYCNSSQYTYQLNYYSLPSISGIATDCSCWPTFGLLQTEGAIFTELGLSGVGFWGAGITYGFISTAVSQFVSNPNPANLFSATFWSNDFLGAASALYPGPDTFANEISAFGFVPACHIGSPDSGAEGMLFSFMQAYGISGISAYFLPIINILITLSAIRGISGLLGGDTQLAGVSRFI